MRSLNISRTEHKKKLSMSLLFAACILSACSPGGVDNALSPTPAPTATPAPSPSSSPSPSPVSPSPSPITSPITSPNPTPTPTPTPSPVPTPTAPSLKAGVISYWGEATSSYDQLPPGALALVNPDNGIFVSAGQSTQLPTLTGFQSIVGKATGRGVSMLGYVPTGYFNHGCNQIGVCQTWVRIEAQVQAYFANFPSLSGIFFDEVSPSVWNCAAFPAEYQQLRAIVSKYKPGATIAFNAGIPDNCAVAGVNSGEIVVLFENDFASYLAQAQNVTVSTQAALAKGAIPWHLIHTVKTVTDMRLAATQAKAAGVTYFYATDIGGNWQAGENTWGSLPVYWNDESGLFY